MADQKLSALTAIPAVDRAADLLYVVDNSGGTSNKVTPNTLLGVTGDPVGTTDTQTLSAKTLTSPTINGVTLSGTLSGTYTIGGTPTFPSSVVTLTGSQTLTNKTLTSPTINTATISNPTLLTDTVSEFTSAAGVTVDGVLLKDAKVNGSYITDSTVANTQLAAGVSVQTVYTLSSAVATGTTLIPNDDTIPQNTEGTEFMTLSITPKSATNVLVIEAFVDVSHSVAASFLFAALFQDSTANALAAGDALQATATGTFTVAVRHAMVAGTTSSTTFKIRGGSSAAGTVTLNGSGGTRRFGAIPKSSMLITEYKA